MPSAKLTDAAVARLKAVPGKRTEHFDIAEPGFALRVSGTLEKPIKTWTFLYRVKGEMSSAGKRLPLHRLTIGPYPAYSLAEAREKAREARKLADRGIDPAKERLAEAAAAQRRAREVRTVASAVDEFMRRYMKEGKRPHAPRYIAETARNFRNHVLDRWGERDIKSITRRDVIELLDAIADAGKPVAANRVRAALSKLFNWSIQRSLLEANPVLLTERPGQEMACDRILADDEINPIWAAGEELGYPFGRFFQMDLATGQRRNEIANMRWQDIDEDARLWTLPAAVTKAKRAPGQVVPLSPIAMDILGQCPRIGMYVFTTRRDQPISGFSKAKREVDELVVKLRGERLKPWTIHDIRRTVGTGLGKLKVPRFIIGRVLNHADRTVTGIYDRYEYVQEKRDALERWGRHLAGIINPPPLNMVQLAIAG
jgi:integrase